ncbi:MAG: hypothetical protein GY947_12850 [Rhodobacteraceae bacterium]|nr:hypothetical protein [Paracoccaceae bacterium]
MKNILNLSNLVIFVVFLISGSFVGPQQAEGSGEVVCTEAALNNYWISFYKCSDNQTWELDCQLDNQTQAYQCSCKKGDTETLTTSMTEAPYDITPENFDQTYQNAVAGAEKICGFKLKYQP